MHKICHYIDFNIANIISADFMQKLFKKYAQYEKKYAKNIPKICRICISLCIGIYFTPLC